MIQRSTTAGTPAFRLFEVAAGGSLMLQNLTVTGGLAQGTGTSAQGGGIYSAGTLNLSGVTVQGNKAQGANGVVVSANTPATVGASASGGGLYMAGGTLSLSNDTITGNSAIGGNGGGSTFFFNLAGDGGVGAGGGLYVAGGSVTLNSNSISGNNATGGVGGYAYQLNGNGGSGSGGGLYLAGGNLSMSGDAITGNNAIGGVGGNGGSGSSASGHFAGGRGTGGTGSGGGLYVGANVVTLGLTNENISNNKTAGGTGGEGVIAIDAGFFKSSGKGGMAQGGGLYVAGGNVTLSADQLTSNAANGGQGGIVFPAASYGGYGGAGGTGFGGGLYAAGGSVTLNNDTVSGNIARGGNGAFGAQGHGLTPGGASYGGLGGIGGAGLGGGVYVTGGVIAMSGGSTTGNNAVGGGGGGPGFYNGSGRPGGAASGGGIDVVGGAVTLSGVAVSSNQASGGVGASGGNSFSAGHGAGGSATGGGMSVSPGVVVLHDSSTSFSGNSVLGGPPGGTASFPDLAANSPGFGLYMLPGGTVTFIMSSLGQSIYGQSVTFTATLTAGPSALSLPTGTVTFYNAGVSLGTGTVNASGVAVLTTNALPAGSDSITAVYSGDSNFTGSTSLAVMVSVSHAFTSTSVSSSVNPSGIGQPVTFTAMVTANSPSPALVNAGSVQFLIDGANFGSPVNVNSSGVAVSAPAGGAQLTVGTHGISAVYSGTANFVTSSTASPVTTSPNAYYPLNEASGTTAHDASGNGFNATYIGGITFGVPGPLPGTTAVQLDGSTGSIGLPATPFGNYPTSGTTNNYSLTFETWFKAPVGSQGGVILSQSSSNGGYVPAVMLGIDGEIRSSLFWLGNHSDIITSSSAYNDGNWHLLDTTYSNGTQSLYIDGALIGTQSLPETAYAASYSYALGTGQTSGWAGGKVGNFYFTGDLAQASIYPIAFFQGQILARNGATVFTQTVTNAPAVIASSFVYDTSPNTLNFTFTKDVSASLSAADLVVQLSGGGTVSPIQYAGYNAATNTASFTLPTGLADGSYSAHFVPGTVTDSASNPLLAGFSFNFFVLSADANRDGKVNALDFNILASNFGHSGATFSQGNFNYDATVNTSDFMILAQQFNKSLTIQAPSLDQAAATPLALAAPAVNARLFATNSISSPDLIRLLTSDGAFDQNGGS
jgi:hypothetical protein